MENNSFTMLNEAGEEVKYDVLFTFDNEETNKSYIAYTEILPSSSYVLSV